MCNILLSSKVIHFTFLIAFCLRSCSNKLRISLNTIIWFTSTSFFFHPINAPKEHGLHVYIIDAWIIFSPFIILTCFKFLQIQKNLNRFIIHELLIINNTILVAINPSAISSVVIYFFKMMHLKTIIIFLNHRQVLQHLVCYHSFQATAHFQLNTYIQKI